MVAWLAGLGLGLGARIVVGLIAAVDPGLARPTWQGSVDLILFGTLVGVVAGMPYLVWRGARGGVRLWVGAAWGGVLALGAALLVPAAARGALAELGFSGRILSHALFTVLFVGWGTGLETVARRSHLGTGHGEEDRGL